MKSKSSKILLEDLDYAPKIENLPQLNKIIEEIKTEDKKTYFQFDVDKKGKINEIFLSS